MLRKKLITRCPKCSSALNPRRFIGTIGLCDKCDWAGSYHSQNYHDWVQMKVSFLLVIAGLAASYAIIRLVPSKEPALRSSLTVAENQALNAARKKAHLQRN